MSRSQQGQVFQQGQQENQTYNQNAQDAFNKAQGDVGTFQGQLSKFASSNPYTQGGEFQTAQNQNLADVSQGTADATKQAVESAAVRTGANMGGAVAGAEEVAQQNQRTLGNQVANANQARIGSEAGYNEKALQGYQTAQQMQDQLAQQQASAAQGALGTTEQAANTPSFTDMLGQGLISAGDSFAGAYCPAEGSLILMADQTSVPIEQLAVGDELQGLDGLPQKVLAIRRAVVPVMLFVSDTGSRGRASRSHALALPLGGFTSVAASKDKRVRAAGYTSARIISVYDDGVAPVYNVITDGSHTYNADGFWALGMSAEEYDAIAPAEVAVVGEVA